MRIILKEMIVSPYKVYKPKCMDLEFYINEDGHTRFYCINLLSLKNALESYETLIRDGVIDLSEYNYH